MPANSPRRFNLIGQTFNRLTVIAFLEQKGSIVYWQCRCICGALRKARSGELRSGLRKSCGCLRREQTIRRSTTHGQATRRNRSSNTYSSWSSAKRRCHNPTDAAFKNYGGRGIEMCEEWRNSFEAFYRDMGSCPPKYTIERIDNNLGYFKENCRWATRADQNSNNRKNRYFTINGETALIAEWTRRKGFSYGAIYSRLRRGWTPEQAILLPKGSKIFRHVK